IALDHESLFFLSSRRRHTRFSRDWSSDVCSSDLMRNDPDSVGLILMNTAQSHFPDVAWLLDRFPLSRRVFTSTSRAVQAQMCLKIGRASCRERVKSWGGVGSFNEKSRAGRVEAAV